MHIHFLPFFPQLILIWFGFSLSIPIILILWFSKQKNIFLFYFCDLSIDFVSVSSTSFLKFFSPLPSKTHIAIILALPMFLFFFNLVSTLLLLIHKNYCLVGFYPQHLSNSLFLYYSLDFPKTYFWNSTQSPEIFPVTW